MSRTYLHRSTGFTLLEMMFAVVLVAILMGLALPSFTVYMQNLQIRAGSEALAAGVQLARAEAVRRNTAVQFVLTSPGPADIKTGWRVSTVAAPDEPLQTRLEDESPDAEVFVTPPGTTMLTFNGFGRVMNPNPDATLPISQLQIRNPNTTPGTCMAGGGKLRCLQLDVTPGGNVRLCDPTYPAGDPRGC